MTLCELTSWRVFAISEMLTNAVVDRMKKAAMKLLNKESRTADKEWYSDFGF
jgi:hypothetical protein